MLSQDLIARLWWGKFRGVFEPAARRWIGKKGRVISGQLKGYSFSGGLAQILGIYEIHVQRAFIEGILPGMVVYDIGANNGFFTLFASHLVGNQGKVFAFEPYPPNMEKLVRNISGNNCSNVFPQMSAVSDSSGNAELSFEGSTATPSLMAISSESSITIGKVSIDDFCLANNMPDFIKVDVEGLENNVLTGAIKLLEKCRPSWIIEIHSEDNEAEVVQFLRKFKYSFRALNHPRTDIKPFPRNIFVQGNLVEA